MKLSKTQSDNASIAYDRFTKDESIGDNLNDYAIQLHSEVEDKVRELTNDIDTAVDAAKNTEQYLDLSICAQCSKEVLEWLTFLG